MFKILLLSLLITLTLSLHLQTQPRSYSSNLNVDNYITGDQPGQLFYFSQLTNPPNIIKYPFYAPFTFTSLTCFQCPLSFPIFNLATQRCENCPTSVQGLINHNVFEVYMVCIYHVFIIMCY